MSERPLPGNTEVPPNRCIRCRKGRRKCGLYCRLCWDHAKARMRGVAKLSWWEWEPYKWLDVLWYEARVLTELRRMCDAESKRTDKETL